MTRQDMRTTVSRCVSRADAVREQAVSRFVNSPFARRVHVARRAPRNRLVPWLIWRWLRWRWPYRRAAREPVERADGTVIFALKPLRVWWPWSWLLAAERWLTGPVVGAVALYGVHRLTVGIPYGAARVVLPAWAVMVGVALVVLRSWWVCLDHRTRLGPWTVRTLVPTLALTGAATWWLVRSGDPVALAAGLGVTVAARWWHYARGRLADVRRIVKRWAVALGAEGRVLAGSVVEDVRLGRSGAFTLYVVLPGGRLTFEDVVRSRGHIATTYHTTISQVRVERGDDDARPVVHVAPPGVLHRVHPWSGEPVGPDGVLTVGLLADERAARLAFWSEVGSKIVWLIGKRGSGKSRAVHLLLSALTRSGLVALDVIDAKGGVDLSRWAVYTVTGTIATDLDGARTALERANAVLDARMGDLLAAGREKYVVGRDGPLWLLVIEEAPEVLSDPECARLMGRLGRLSRAGGVGVLLVSQVAKVDAVGGRDVVQNVDTRVIFECDRQTAGQAIDGRSQVDMSRLPPGRPGVALWLGEGAEPDMLGRWFDVDPDTVTDGAQVPALDPAAARVLAGPVVSCAPAPDLRALVAAYYAEHPDASSGQASRATGVPAGTIRRWRAQSDAEIR